MIKGRLLLAPKFVKSAAVWLSSASNSDVLTSERNGKRIVTLNRPRALNALSLPMVRTLYPMFRVWNNERSTSVIILKGAGTKAFCAGGDVVAVTKSARSGDPSQTIHKDFFREEYLLNHLIGVLSMPFVALIDGITMGGGCGLSINGRFRVATERTMLAMPETALGLFPDVGGSYFLSRLPHNLGIFLALTGYRLQGADVYHAGLATHYVPSSLLGELEEALITLPNKDVSEANVCSILDKFHSTSLPKFSLESHLKDIQTHFTAPSVESIFESLRKSESDFAKKQLVTLSTMSPTSMKVTFRQLQEGAKMKFSEVFTMEYRLTQRFMAGHDFHEGCRAILIDKDRKPVWDPPTLEGITDKAVDKYFSPLPSGDLFIDDSTHK